MPVLAGWLTGEQVTQEIIEQVLETMSGVLGRYGGQPARNVQPGAGLVAFSDSAYAMQRNDEPPVLDWVPDRRTLVYRRPLSGLHALYYAEDWPAPGNLLFASEVKALLAAGVPRSLRLAALDALLRYGFIPAPWTIFKHINIVPAGSILRWQRAKTVVNASTDFRLDEPLPASGVLAHLQTQLNEAVEGLLPPHEQLMALTGGGACSALATLLATQHTATPFTIATLGYKKSAKTWQAAEHVADACQHPFLAITGVDQPDFWIATIASIESPCLDTRPFALHQLLHTAAAETGARVAISGLGGHLLLGAQLNTAREQSTEATESDILTQYRKVISRDPPADSPLWSAETAAALHEEERWEETLHARKLARQAAKFSDSRQGYYYLDLHLRLPDLVVNPLQQLAIQERLVVRSPYLNPHMLEMLTRLPAELEDDTPKTALAAQLLRQHLPDSVASPLPLIAPAASLLRIEDSELLQQTLSTEALQATGIFDVQAVEALLRQARGKAASRELLLVFTTQLLYRLFEMTKE